MVEVQVLCDPRPAEELVTEYAAYVDGAEVVRVPAVADQTEVAFNLQFDAPAVHSIQVAAVGPYGLGPLSAELKTAPATGQVGGLRFGKIVVTAQASASAVVE